ncbi:AAA family ATPase [bacterium]|nr:AAA family ATPase [bacterium]
MKVYVAATRQNDGKTMVCLGLLNALSAKFKKIGYMKPVGQQYIVVDGDRIDKDAVLVKQLFNLDSRLPDINPVSVPSGFTAEYILKGNREELVRRVKEGFQNVSRDKEITLLEGTGHAGVGSVFDMSNADAAALLGSKVVIVSLGGIGRPIDEIMLNKAMFEKQGVEVVGAIINKVRQDKFDKVNELVRKGLERKGLTVLGVVPFNKVLASPTIAEVLDHLKGKIIAGEKGLTTAVSRFVVVAMPSNTALEYFVPGALLITPGNREDIILAALARNMVEADTSRFISGIVLTCGIYPDRSVLRLAQQVDMPLILVPEDTYPTASKIHSSVFKIRPEDTAKVMETARLVNQYVDVDRILELIKE